MAVKELDYRFSPRKSKEGDGGCKTGYPYEPVTPEQMQGSSIPASPHYKAG